MAKKVDRRVRKTKMQLRQGLARLMQKKSIKEITVKELGDEVDIMPNRRVWTGRNSWWTLTAVPACSP